MPGEDPKEQPAVAAAVHADTDKHHREIWSDARSGGLHSRPPVYYIENHNGQIGYAEAALDFEIAVEHLLPRLDPMEYGNWLAPVLHLARQTLELRLKALLEAIVQRDAAVDARPLGKHDLDRLWQSSKAWLRTHGYQIDQDARLSFTDELVLAFHAVDPVGDLFRFALSRNQRFGKRKSYDRVGVNNETFKPCLMQALGMLGHWEAVIFRERMKQEMGWEKDPFFNPDDFPRVAPAPV